MTSRARRAHTAAARAQVAAKSARPSRVTCQGPSGTGQVQLASHVGAHLVDARTEAGRCACCAVEARRRQTASRRPGSSRRSRAHLAQERGQLGAERGGHGLLAVRAPGHHRLGVRLHLLREGVTQVVGQHDQPVEGPCQLQTQAGVHDVLGGGTVVQRATLGLGQALGELPHQGQDGIAHVGHVGPQGCADRCSPASMLQRWLLPGPGRVRRPTPGHVPARPPSGARPRRWQSRRRRPP